MRSSLSFGDDQAGGHHLAPEALRDVEEEDEVGGAVLILDGEEHHALGTPRPLPHEGRAGHAQPFPLPRAGRNPAC